MQRSRVWVAALLALAACADNRGGYGGDPVQPTIKPPELERVQLEPPDLERSEVVKIGLKPPRALPARQVESFKQKPGTVDILWVIDNSGSMADERTLLADNFQRFVDILVQSGTDFHIGTIATDQDLGAKLHGGILVITPSTANPHQAFLDQVTFPAGRVRWVQGLAMTKKFLSTPTLNQSFLRPGAALAIIALSDGDDDSFGGTGYFARFLREVKGQGNENVVSFSTISGDLPNGCQAARDAQYYGSKAEPSPRYTDMARRTGGVVGSICDVSFENTLVRIATGLNTLRKLFPLSLKPDVSTLRVLVNGQPVANDAQNGWTYAADINAIQFLGSYVPPPNADLQIQYAIAP